MSAPGVARAIAGIEGTFDYAIDAPWRIEPSVGANGQLEYGAIPIVISIHDESEIDFDTPDRHLGRLCEVVVRQTGLPDTEQDRSYGIDDLAEIEVTYGNWSAPDETKDPPETCKPPQHFICRHWKGEDCGRYSAVQGSSEWHALLFHAPPAVSLTPGTYIPLSVTAKLARTATTSCTDEDRGNFIWLINHVRVYLATDPLPRFGRNSLYGDLHYHSEGTDNEGESAYNYRGVVRAMGAMGLDFAFATEHASASTRIADGDLDIDFEFVTDVFQRTGGLRDMCDERFDSLLGRLHGVTRVNGEATLGAPGERMPQGVLSHGVGPQIFLGGEVDLIPEIARGYANPLEWGNRRYWSIDNLCGGFEDYVFGAGPLDECRAEYLDSVTGEDPDAVLVRDLQGLNDLGFARHHVIYLPRDSSDDRAFVASRTGFYGGASRRFKELEPEFVEHGYFFAAHPLGHPEGGSAGPDDMPWTDHLFQQLFESPAGLGLQFWNEGTRLTEDVPAWSASIFLEPVPELEALMFMVANDLGRFCHAIPPPTSHELRYILCPTAAVGGDLGYERLDSRQAVFGFKKAWPVRKAPTNDARFGFSRIHGAFELQSPAARSGLWEARSFGIEEKLHHGAFTWDRLNHWGLDVAKTLPLEWVPGLEPRRLFMAGGSDAHGDLNYRREGYLTGTDKIVDTALGKPRNLVESGAPDGTSLTPGAHSQTQIVDAIAAGRFSVTDGPALRIAIDRNGTGVIDEGDAGMGDVVELDGSRQVSLLVEWKSTPEFGQIGIVDLYLGSRSSELDHGQGNGEHQDGRTYARSLAGPFHESIPGISVLPDASPWPPLEDGAYHRMPEGYWHDETGELSFIPANGFAGVKAVTLDLDRFPAVMEAGRDDLETDRFFVRAVASASLSDIPCTEENRRYERSGCIIRYAFTNPIWLMDTTYLCSEDAGLDQGDPALDCNAPATLEPPSQPVSFMATAEDLCDVAITASSPECFSFTKKGKKITRDCTVTTSGDTVTVVDGGGVASHVRWQLTASDEAGNTSTTACELQLTRPPK